MKKKNELVNGCMAKAEDDEMTFVLLERDKASPATIRFWIQERIKLGLNKSGDAKLVEAENCASYMEST